MTPFLEAAALDPSDIERRLRFLSERDEYVYGLEHTQSLTPLQRMGRAGTLNRDAACLAFMLGDYEQAKVLLRKAGSDWARIGLFAAYALLRLADGAQWSQAYESDLEAIHGLLNVDPVDNSVLNDTRAWSGEELHAEPDSPPDEEPILRAYLKPSTTSPRQLLNLLQACAGRHNRAAHSVAELVRQRLQGLRLEVTRGMALQRYVSVLNAISSGQFNSTEHDGITLVVLNRTEGLAAAQSDAYHWKRMLNPELMIDFDFLVLCILAVENGLTEKIDPIMRNRSALVSFPWLIAQELASPDPEPELESIRRYF